MDNAGYIFLALMWIGVLFSAITGIIANPKYQVRRKDDPREFWIAFWWYSGVVFVMTVISFFVIDY